jgi:hypothetical protein
MDWQQMVSLLIVAVAGGLMLRSRFRPRQFSFQRDTHCGCAISGVTAPAGSVVFRARRGNRPEVLWKMR